MRPKTAAGRTGVRTSHTDLLEALADLEPGSVDFNKLKQQPGDEIQVSGSGALAQTLIRHDLVDEYRLLIFPVLLGAGKRLFASGTTPCGLKLVDTTTSSTGVTINTYQRHGDVDHGAMGPEHQPDQ